RGNGIYYLHSVCDSSKNCIATVKMMCATLLLHNKKLIGRREFIRIVNITAGHTDHAPVMNIPAIGVCGQKVIANFLSFFGYGHIIAIASLNDKVFDDTIKLGVIKILLLGQKDEIGTVEFCFVKQ